MREVIPMVTQGYDIIGDIHGYAQSLERLLQKMEYRQTIGGYYQHPTRKAIFVGDLIDRGPENFRTMEIVKAMADAGSAQIVMGNHEYNALCYHTQNSNGHFLRPHNEKNFNQHQRVLEEIDERGDKEWNIYLEWFRQMPLFLEMEDFRVIHACWHAPSIDFLKRVETSIRDNRGRLTDNFLIRSAIKDTGEYNTVEFILKGDEILLPHDHPGVYDRDGNYRRKTRVKWWLTDEEKKSIDTYDQVVRADPEALTGLKGVKLPAKIAEQIRIGYGADLNNSTPVFFGHYWFSGELTPLTSFAACLDFSAGLGGPLVCYRFNGEKRLEKSAFVFA